MASPNSPIINLKSNSTSTEPQGLISDAVRLIFQAVNYAILCELINIFGSVTNIINIVCFIKQGFKDSVNVTLLGLALSDLGCLVTLIWMNLCFNPLFHQADLPFDSIEIQYLTGGWPHVIFTRVTSWITAFITIERCLCITMPLKVKNLITPRRVTIFIICTFVLLIASVTPVYYVNKIGWKFFPERNKTMLGLVYTSNREEIETISFALNNVFIPCTAFAVVITCTIILVAHLKKKARWRLQVASSGKSDALSLRDDKVAKMVVMISVLFVVCFVPVCIIFVAMAVEPEFAIDGQYRNMFFVVFSFGFILESTNSSLNIFIYYKMSSKYRLAFRELFRLENKESNKRMARHHEL